MKATMPPPAPAPPVVPPQDVRVRPSAPAPAPAPPAPAPPAPVARPQVVPVPQMRQATPLEQQWQQRMQQPPQQTFFDIGTGDLVQRSFDAVSGLDEIRKKMGYFDGFLRRYKNE